MKIEEKLKELMIKKSGSVNKFASDCGLPYSTIATIFRRGIDKTNINTVIKICQALHISADELAEGRITFIHEVKYQQIEFDKLSDLNQEKLMSYYQALLDSQET